MNPFLLVWIALLAGVFWFMILRPRREAARQRREVGHMDGRRSLTRLALATVAGLVTYLGSSGMAFAAAPSSPDPAAPDMDRGTAPEWPARGGRDG